MKCIKYKLNMVTGCSSSCDYCTLKYDIRKFNPETTKILRKKYRQKIDSLQIVFHEYEYFRKIPSDIKYIDCTSLTDASDWIDFHFMLLNQKAMIYPNKIFIISTKKPIHLIGRKFQKNIWIALSCKNQIEFELGIESLRHIDISKRIVKFEPLEEEIVYSCDFNYIDWAIVGVNKNWPSKRIGFDELERTVKNLKIKKIPTYINSIDKNGIYIDNMAEFPKHLRLKNYPI